MCWMDIDFRRICLVCTERYDCAANESIWESRKARKMVFCAEIQDGEIFAFRTNNQSLARGLRYQDDDVRVIDQEQTGWLWMADASRDLSSTGCLAILEFPCILSFVLRRTTERKGIDRWRSIVPELQCNVAREMDRAPAAVVVVAVPVPNNVKYVSGPRTPSSICCGF